MKILEWKQYSTTNVLQHISYEDKCYTEKCDQDLYNIQFDSLQKLSDKQKSLCWKLYILSLVENIYSEKYCNEDVVKYTFYILEKMYADPPVIEHFGMETKQGRKTLSFDV